MNAMQLMTEQELRHYIQVSSEDDRVNDGRTHIALCHAVIIACRNSGNVEPFNQIVAGTRAKKTWVMQWAKAFAPVVWKQGRAALNKARYKMMREGGPEEPVLANLLSGVRWYDYAPEATEVKTDFDVLEQTRRVLTRMQTANEKGRTITHRSFAARLQELVLEVALEENLEGVKA